METVVLPAQDHLAQERYRHQSRVMSGMIYPFGGLPRTRRKVKSPPQVFAAASLHSETARVASNRNAHAAEVRSEVRSPMDVTVGVLRSAPSSGSTPPHPPMAVLKTPQYRLHNTASSGFLAHESSSPPQKQQLGASFSAPVLSGATAASRQVLRTRSDGELLQGSRKGVQEVEKTSERKGSYEKGAEGTKKTDEKMRSEKTLERVVEKSADRRKVSERRIVEKKISSNQGDRSSNVQKKVGTITILQRPQTKEAAAENMAKITGRPIEVVAMEMFKPAQVLSQPLEQAAEKVAPADASAGEDVREGEVLLKDGESDSLRPGHVSTVSPKKVGKKKALREFSGKAGPRSPLEIVNVDARSTKETEKQPLRVISDREVRKNDEGKREPSPVSPPSPGRIVSNLTNRLSPSLSPTRVLLRGPSDSFVVDSGQALADGRNIGVSRSGSFREVPRAYSDSSVELFLLPSPPAKNSERWAGPAYTNSPPPSTLPFPTFPIQRLKSSLTAVTLANVVSPEDAHPFAKSSSAPSSPTRGVTSLFFSTSSMQSPFMDPLSATKDLRRMLNLDVEGAHEGGGSILKPKDTLRDSATQGLKRILQLS